MHKLHLNIFTRRKIVVMLYARRRNVYQPGSYFDRCRIVVQLDCRLSYCSITIRVGRVSKTVCRVWNRWFQEVFTEHCAGSQRTVITKSREHRYLILMALIDLTYTSRALSKEMGPFASQEVSS